MAIPRIVPHGFDGVALPQPLPPSQATRLRGIFAAQARGQIAVAVQAMKEIDQGSPLGVAMIGHVLSDRYLGRFYRSSPQELTEWLKAYPDQPDAPAIHALLVRRLPRGAAPPPAPAAALLTFSPPDQVPEEAEPDALAINRNPKLDATVHERAHAGNDASALRLIARTRGLSVSYGALLRAEVAQTVFTANRDAEALQIASDAMTQSDGKVGLAAYIAGLAAWRLDRPQQARTYFETAARAKLTSPAIRSAAAFWAARAHVRTRDPTGYIPWMKRAAAEPRTFYGMLARRTLGIGIGAGFAWDRETLGGADVDAVAATPEGMAAFALLQIGQNDRAEAELRLLFARIHRDMPKDYAPLTRAIMLVADKAGLYDLSAQLATEIQIADGRPRDYARFPVPHLAPRNGFQLDPALVYALTRIESNFDTTAVSPAGARGLMQIMPVTAGYMASEMGLSGNAGARLHEPAFNLEIGQRYVLYLAHHDVVDDNLIRLLASYNAGPGNFTHWSANVHDDGDPLLFIESIPTDETRAFVQRVLTYTWIYAARLRVPAPSLDELAAGAFPRFEPRKQRDLRRVAVLH